MSPEYDTPAARAQYRVWQEGVATVVKRKGHQEWSSSTVVDLMRFFVRWRIWSPEVLRFLKAVVALSPGRVLLKLVGGFFESLQPLLHVYFVNMLLKIAYSAVETRKVDRRRLAFAVIGRIISGGLQDVLQHALRDNDGVLQLLFNSMIEEHVMAARARLDIATQQRPAISRVFRNVGRMSSNSSWGGLLRDTIDGANSLFTIVVQIGVLRALTTRENRSYLALSSLGFLGTLRWIFRSPNRERREETDPHFQQMRILFENSEETTARQESKMLNLDQFFLERYKTHARALGNVSIDMDGPRSRISRLAELVENAVDAGLFARYALKECRPGAMITITVPDLQFIRAASRTLVQEVSSLFSFAYDFQHNVTAIREFYELASIPVGIPEPSHPVPYRSIPGEGVAIECRDVVFAYPHKSPAIKGISFKIKPGQVVALVGDNAAGKSTLIRLLTRLADPSSGQVLINGVDVKEYRSQDLHANISVLFQDSASMNLNLSIKEFIGVGSLEKMDDLAAIMEAAKEAGIHDAIMKLPMGYESRLGPFPPPPTPEHFFRTCLREDWEEANIKYKTSLEREAHDAERKARRKAARAAQVADVKKVAGAEEVEEEEEDDADEYESAYPACSFSGGEFQRLATARALLRNADLKIFDEFSSSLDPLAEREVFRQLWRSAKTSTVLYVTHRFASVPFADLILCMVEGHLVEQGTHDELLAAGGHYAEMYQAASAGFTTAGGESYVVKEGEEAEGEAASEGTAVDLAQETEVDKERERH